jgi:predicted NUDIX family phosphoesterase
MSEASNVHPSEVGLATPPELTKKELAKLANIIAFFRDDAEKAFPVQGIEVMTDPSRDVLRERLEALKPGTLVAQRARIEKDPYFRHPIPYIIIFRQRDDGSLEFFVYQRTKLIGEDLLGQKYSVALGGHPEAPSIRFHEDWSFNTTESLMACLVSELDEEATFNGLSFSDYSETGGMFTYAHDAFLRDDSDAVGLQHIGIVYTIGLPANVEVECIEEELITVGFRTLDELAADLELPEVNAIYDFENWSRICIKSFADRIEATKSQEATDALFLQEEGNELPPEDEVDQADAPTYPRGLRPELVHIDEAPFLAEGDIGRGQLNPQTFYREEDLVDLAQFNLGVAEPISEELYALHKEHGVDLKTLELGEFEEFVQRNGSVFYSGQITHPVSGAKELNIHIMVEDKDPLNTIKLVREQLAVDWAGATEPLADGVKVDLAPKVAAFAQELLEQADRPLSAGPNGDWKPYNPEPVDPSAETKVLTEAHREIGTTDDQMKVAVDELTRISDSVQPTEAERLSDLAS